MSEAEKEAVKKLRDFFAGQESILYLRLLAGGVVARDERECLVVDSEEYGGSGRYRLICLRNSRESPFITTIRWRPPLKVGDFLSFRDRPPNKGTGLSNFPVSIEDAIGAISKRGIIPLDKIVDWICERLVSE